MKELGLALVLLFLSSAACAPKTPEISLVQAYPTVFATAIPLGRNGRYLTCKHVVAGTPIWITDAHDGSRPKSGSIVESATENTGSLGGEDWALIECSGGSVQIPTVEFDLNLTILPGERVWIAGWVQSGATIRKEVLQTEVLRICRNPPGIFVRKSTDLRGCSGGPAWINKNGKMIVFGFISRSSWNSSGKVGQMAVPKQPWDFIELLPNSVLSLTQQDKPCNERLANQSP